MEQGNVFRHAGLQKIVNAQTVSIPLEQGNVFRLLNWIRVGLRLIRLNPFGTGQCLSTEINNRGKDENYLKSQSLWNRAMSFDNLPELETIRDICLNPFGTGQCLSTH